MSRGLLDCEDMWDSTDHRSCVAIFAVDPDEDIISAS